jgi:HD-GYP domain-containing protein (c-di-GMP phosphodiesterase class II)
MSETVFFHIKKELLGTRKIFPFQIYVYDPKDKTHNSFLKANSPLTKSQSQDLTNRLARGCSIAISEKQRITFQRTLKLKKDDPIFANPVNELPGNITSVDKNTIANKKKPAFVPTKTKRVVKSEFTKQEFEMALQANNYRIIIEKAHKELSEFCLTDCQTTSLAVHLSNKFLITDTKLNRVVTISYFFAKALNINDETNLASLVCAGFFSQIGMMSMALRLSRMEESEYNTEEKTTYEKYPSLSLHLCKKAEMDVTPEFQTTLLDHQEKLSGSGFPNSKSGKQLSEPSLVIGFVSHIVEHNDKELTLLEFINQNHKYLLLEFGEKIVNTFLEMLKTSTFKKAA